MKPQTSASGISPARLAAFQILTRVSQHAAYASELLHSGLLSPLSPADRGLCTELVMGVLRWQSVLDRQIEGACSQPLRKLDQEVLVALRLGAYQLRFLSRIPARAAVNESVELVKRARKRSAAPLVNAVLRKLIRGAEASSAAPAMAGVEPPASVVARTMDSGPENTSSETSSPAQIALQLAHPEWLVARWVRHFGAETARRICDFDQQAPITALRLSAAGSVAIEQQFEAAGVQLAPGHLLRSARLVRSGSDITRMPAFSEHRIAIQDEGSQLVAALVGRGSRILDCCAAPGSKTAVLAEANPDAQVIAIELHPHRAELLRRRLGLANKLPASSAQKPGASLKPAFGMSGSPAPADEADNSSQDNEDSHRYGRAPTASSAVVRNAAAIEVLTADATALPFGREFDRILADVPCSGTGTLARNPEIKWKLRPEDLLDLQARQKAILAAALRHLAPGGVLVYSTCSLEPEENERVVEGVLSENTGFTLLDCRRRLDELKAAGELTWPDVSSLVHGPYLQTLPGVQPCDGFFAAMIVAIE